MIHCWFFICKRDTYRVNTSKQKISNTCFGRKEKEPEVPRQQIFIISKPCEFTWKCSFCADLRTLCNEQPHIKGIRNRLGGGEIQEIRRQTFANCENKQYFLRLFLSRGDKYCSRKTAGYIDPEGQNYASISIHL